MHDAGQGGVSKAERWRGLAAPFCSPVHVHVVRVHASRAMYKHPTMPHAPTLHTHTCHTEPTAGAVCRRRLPASARDSCLRKISGGSLGPPPQAHAATSATTVLHVAMPNAVVYSLGVVPLKLPACVF